MIAFRAFSQAPESVVPPGIPLAWPWQVTECSEENADEWRKKGYSVVSQEQYDAYLAQCQADYDAWLPAAPALLAIRNIEKGILNPAIEAGVAIIRRFSAENIAMGITQLGMTTQVRTYTAEVIQCLSTGSLYDAITQIRAIPEEHKDATFITNTRLLSAINQIEDYLGVTRSTSL